MQSQPAITFAIAPLTHVVVRSAGAEATPSVATATSRKGNPTELRASRRGHRGKAEAGAANEATRGPGEPSALDIKPGFEIVRNLVRSPWPGREASRVAARRLHPFDPSEPTRFTEPRPKETTARDLRASADPPRVRRGQSSGLSNPTRDRQAPPVTRGRPDLRVSVSPLSGPLRGLLPRSGDQPTDPPAHLRSPGSPRLRPGGRTRANPGGTQPTQSTRSAGHDAGRQKPRARGSRSSIG